MRLSNFTIIVPLTNFKNKFLLAHGYTGAIDIVTSDVIDYITTIGINNTQTISNETIQILTQRGYITTKSEDDEYKYVQLFGNLINRTIPIQPKQFMFMVAYNCNFRCPYCFERKLSPFCKQWSGQVLSKEMINKAYQTIPIIEPNEALRSKQILLYGGEPLLKENKEIIKYIVSSGNKFGYHFGAITNGYDLNYFEDLLSENMIQSVQITVDGNKEHHNQKRIHYLNKNSFDVIIKNIGIALRKGTKVSIRINTDYDNIDDVEELRNLLDNLGYTKYSNLHINSALLVDYSQNKDCQVQHIKYMNRQEYINKIKQSNTHNFQDFGLYQRLYFAIKHQRPLSFRSFFCSSQSGMYIFDPFGDIYSCWNDVGNINKIIGKYKNDLTWTEEKDKWHKMNVLSFQECQHCKYIFICRGGCASHAFLKNNGQKPDCDNFEDTFIYTANKVCDNYFKKL